MAYFELLDSKEQLEAYREIRDRLGAEPESPEVAKVIERANAKVEALDAFRKVAEHLGLAEGVAPTPGEFDSACKELRLPWNRSREKRTFESWRRGRDAFLGRRVSLSPKEREENQRTARGKNEDLLRGVKMFLETNPPRSSSNAYDLWRSRYNHSLPQGACRSYSPSPSPGFSICRGKM